MYYLAKCVELESYPYPLNIFGKWHYHVFPYKSYLMLRIPVATDAFVNAPSIETSSLSTVTATGNVSPAQPPSTSSNSVSTGGIVGGVIGGLVLIACMAAFVIWTRRTRKVDKQEDTYNLSQWNYDGNRDNPEDALNTEPGREQSEIYGTPRGLIYRDNPSSVNLQRDN